MSGRARFYYGKDKSGTTESIEVLVSSEDVMEQSRNVESKLVDEVFNLQIKSVMDLLCKMKSGIKGIVPIKVVLGIMRYDTSTLDTITTRCGDKLLVRRFSPLGLTDEDHKVIYVKYKQYGDNLEDKVLIKTVGVCTSELFDTRTDYDSFDNFELSTLNLMIQYKGLQD